MAKPRVFVSSTFYDLRQVRTDLERFVRDLGYEPILNERGNIPYEGSQKLEDAAYREVQLSDILVAIIGGRFGTEAKESPYSISQLELKTAVEQGVQVFIFIEQSVRTEFETYRLNKDMDALRYHSVDNPKIFEFIEEVLALPLNNATTGFETAQDITRYLREQWSGLFQRFLSEQRLLKETRTIQDIQATAATLRQLVTFLAAERDKGDTAIREILMSNHPALKAVQAALNIRYRIYFANHDELDDVVKARGWKPVNPEAWDDSNFEEWINERAGSAEAYRLLKIFTEIWDESGKLKVITPEDWSPEWVRVEPRPEPEADFPPAPDDIPF